MTKQIMIMERYTTDGTPYQCPLCIRLFFSPIAYGMHKCKNKKTNINARHYIDNFIVKKNKIIIKGRR